jgi:nicotinamidase-related amidase
MSELIAAASSQLLIVDAQQRLVPALLDPSGMTARVKLLCLAAKQLRVPVTVSEQYPQGLGATLPEIGAALPEDVVILPKMHFNGLREDAIRERLGSLKLAGRGRLIICGAETHVCVLQSAIAAQEAGYRVCVVSDASSSRRSLDHAAGLARMAGAGVSIVTADMVVFEWLGQAGTDMFRSLVGSIKQI